MSVAFHAHGDAHAAADAQGGQALLGVAALHLEQQRIEHARARGADGVADGDGAAVDIDLVGIPAQPLVDGAGLRREGLVGLDQVEVLDGPAGLLQRLLGSGDRPRAHDRGVDAGVCPGDDAGERRDAPLPGLLQRHEDDGRRAVVDAAGAARRDRAVLIEGRAELGKRLVGHAVLDELVVGEHGLALARLDDDGDDLVLELAGLLGGLSLVLRGDGEAVLLLARDLPLAGHVLGRVAHVVAVEGVPQAILDHGVDELHVAHLGAVAQVGAVRRLAHALLAAGDDDVGGAERDLLGAERDRAQARAAQLVDAPGGRIDRDAGGWRPAARDFVAGARRQDLAHDDFVTRPPVARVPARAPP